MYFTILINESLVINNRLKTFVPQQFFVTLGFEKNE